VGGLLTAELIGVLLAGLFCLGHLQRSTKKSFVNNFFEFFKTIFLGRLLKFFREGWVGVVYIRRRFF
jgi:hypothetical protein